MQSMPSSGALIIGVFAGAIGTGYVLYGRSQQMAVPMVSGVLLCAYPYFTDSLLVLIGIGIVLVILPFVVRV